MVTIADKPTSPRESTYGINLCTCCKEEKEY